MIEAEFVAEGGKLKGFSVKGHAGYKAAPHDIICAAVSAMTNLVANTLTESFGAECDIESDENKPLITLDVKNADDISSKVLDGFFIELSEMEKQYPKFVSVKKIEK